jgi:hypothetical protein
VLSDLSPGGKDAIFLSDDGSGYGYQFYRLAISRPEFTEDPKRS